MNNKDAKPSFVIKIQPKQYFIDGDFAMGLRLLEKYPFWCGNYRLVYKNKKGISFIENDPEMVLFDFMYEEKISLEEAEKCCPEVLI